jgi:drug/metabolite transporter (DMT)-like permease
MRLIFLTLLTLLAFAGNSVLCRMALTTTAMDAASFTTVRLLSGAVMLSVLVWLRSLSAVGGDAKAGKAPGIGGNWLSALALFVYAAALSFSYGDLSTGTGALLLFGAVQATMIATGLWVGERPTRLQGIGQLMAIAGLIAILLPGITAPPLGSAVLMMGSGVMWAVYTLRGRRVTDPTGASAGNFVRAAVLSVVLSLLLMEQLSIDPWGLTYAVLSGAVTSGLGYVLWYTVLPSLTVARAASVQLSVPMIATLAGALLLQESITLRLLLASTAILGGIALAVMNRRAK